MILCSMAFLDRSCGFSIINKGYFWRELFYLLLKQKLGYLILNNGSQCVGFDSGLQAHVHWIAQKRTHLLPLNWFGATYSHSGRHFSKCGSVWTVHRSS